MRILRKIRHYVKEQASFKIVDLEDKLHIQLFVGKKKVSATYLMKKVDNEASINQAKESLGLHYCVSQGYKV